MEWTILAFTLVAAILIGYILGKGTIHVRPPPPVTHSISPPPPTRSSKTSGSSGAARPKNSRRASPPAADLPRAAGEVALPEAPVPAKRVTHDEPSPPPLVSRGASPIAHAHDTLPASIFAPPASALVPPPSSSVNSSAANSPRHHRGSSASSEGNDSRRGSVSGASGGASKRIVIVAKQLPLLTRVNPVTGRFTKEDPATGRVSLEHAEWEDNRSFLSGLRALRADGYQITWVGVPNTGGVPLSRDEQDAYEELVLEEDCVPVFLSHELSEKYFNGFCKGILWPMLHYVLPQSNQKFSEQWDELWQAYNAANAAFSTVISRCVDGPTDTIWIHNYHLLLLPSLLRRKLPRAKIGLFIHTPFPSSDVFRVLPTRHNILSSIMASDLIAFHTFDYARHFLSCIKRVMDLDFETLPGGALGIKYSGRFVSLLISHVGIDSEMFQQTREDRLITSMQRENGANGLDETAIAAPQPTVAEEVARLRAKYAPRRIILSAGDLDSVKGGLLKFQAYARFFDRYPEHKSSVVFVEMLLPNRSVRLDHVQDLKDLLEEQVAAIHAQHGPEVLEVLQLKEALPLKSAVAYYAAADVCIASQFWDGLNLIPFEYTASQMDQTNPGVTIISEFMGCSRTLSGVLRVNPWNLDDVASALNVALGMSPTERVVNHHRRYKYVMDHTIERWGRGFLQHLDRATKLCEGMNYVQVGWGSNVKLMGLRSDFTHLDEEIVTAAYRRAERRVLLLDYDGTLTPADKSSTKSRLMGPSKQVKKLLRSLTRDENNVVFIMSGRTRSILTEWFPQAEFPELGLAAEKGLFLSWPQRLTFLCRQDVRRDTSLRRRIEEAMRAKEVARLAQLEKNAAQTSESRSQAFTDVKHRAANGEKLDLQLDQDNEDEDETIATEGARTPLQGDAHLLVEEAAVPVIETEWERMIALDDVSWKSMALEIIRSYTEQTDGSWIEDKEFAIVWHYEQADPEYGRMQASELQKLLVKVLANPHVDVVRYDYNRILEIKPHGVSKGLAATAILEELFMMHNGGKIRTEKSRPPSPSSSTSLGGIDEMHEGSGGLSRSRHGSHTNLASLAGSRPLSPRGGDSLGGRAQSCYVFQPTATSASSALPPFLFCVGDDRSDEDMFLSVQNKDYLEGKLRMSNLSHTGGTLPGAEAALKRSMSASTAHHPHSHSHSHSHSRHRSDRPSSKVVGEVDEKSARERHKSRIADPFTFTVCVGMKPSNAHYYLHDDEEVVRLLSSLGTSSQRMAQTREADYKALATQPAASPIAGATVRSFPSGALHSVTVRSGGGGSGGNGAASASAGFHLRPADIPTSPPVPLTTLQSQPGGNVALRKSASPTHPLGSSGSSTFRTLSQQRSNVAAAGDEEGGGIASASASEVDEEEESDEPSSDEEKFRQRQQRSSTRTNLASMVVGGLRR